ncbi:MAG: flagellar biosynthesis anti-sigma factor FlgM [Nitrospinota bacterium]
MLFPRSQPPKGSSLVARGKAAQLIQAALRSVPEVRQDRVAAIKKAVATGSYEVDPDKVAEGILREVALDTLLSQGFFE